MKPDTKGTSNAKVVRVANEIAASIGDLPAPVTDEQVLDVFASQRRSSKAVLGDAFQLLDNKPSRFANHAIWHPRLRSLRNNVALGERLFALFE